MKPFQLISKCPDSMARRGEIHTPHGVIPTPCFAPVGTQACVKALTTGDLERLGADLTLANTYHLMLRPGPDIIEKAGGLHSFMNWNRPILTDSGGFQVFSLDALRKISEEGVEFKSHLDGTKLFLGPESAIDIQWRLGADIVMVFDECPAWPAEEDYVRNSMELTLRWAKRSKDAFDVHRNANGTGRQLFGIVQGGTYPKLRRESARRTVELGFDGYALGGLSVGEPKPLLHEMLEVAVPELPENAAHYLMGVGAPEDLWEAVERGIDLFDCVMPTRNARNGQLFTMNGKLNIRNTGFRDDFRPVEEGCPCECCQRHTRAYLCHLFRAGELSALRYASLHNIAFVIRLARKIRESIEGNRFKSAKQSFLSSYLAQEVV